MPMSREGWVVRINIDLERELFDSGGIWIPPHRGWGRRLTELLEVAFGRPLAPVNARGWSAADRLKRRYVWDVERALWVAGQVCGHDVEFYTQEEAERVVGPPPSAEDRDHYERAVVEVWEEAWGAVELLSRFYASGARRAIREERTAPVRGAAL